MELAGIALFKIHQFKAMKPKMKYAIQERYVQSDEWHHHPHAKEFDKYADAEAYAKNEMAVHHAYAYRVVYSPALDLEDGLMLYDKWKAGPFNDTDGTEALDKWLWSNIDKIFTYFESVNNSDERCEACESLHADVMPTTDHTCKKTNP